MEIKSIIFLYGLNTREYVNMLMANWHDPING